MVRTGRVSATDRHREQLLGPSSGRCPPARLESPAGRFRRRPAPAGRAGSAPRRAAGHRLPSAREGRRAAEDPEQHLRRDCPACTRDIPKPPTLDKSRPASGRPNNVYADKNGEVYRKTKEGWQQRTNDTWRNSGGATSSGPKTSGKTAGKGATALPRRRRARPVDAPRAAPRAGARFLGPAARRGARAELVAPRGPAVRGTRLPWRRKLPRRRQLRPRRRPAAPERTPNQKKR